MKILVIGAHPDDYELGLAGTIMKHVENGDEVHGIVATKGDVIGKGSERLRETKVAGKFLGLKSLTFFDMKDTKIKDDKVTIDKIEKYVNKILAAQKQSTKFTSKI